MAERLHCDLPCRDVNRDFVVPSVYVNRDEIRVVMISESPPENPEDYYYRNPDGAFFRTTRLAFADAGFEVSSYADLTRLGIYLTTALKCSKQGYFVGAETIRSCSLLLEKEIAAFPRVRVIMCMGDYAIREINSIVKRKTGSTVFPSGSTYKIRKAAYERDGIAYFPSYTQTGPSFDIEKSKRAMIAEDIARAMALL